MFLPNSDDLVGCILFALRIQNRFVAHFWVITHQLRTTTIKMPLTEEKNPTADAALH